jgi:anti-sigma regulatory factor (Ser/Thr protein kinase)
MGMERRPGEEVTMPDQVTDKSKRGATAGKAGDTAQGGAQQFQVGMSNMAEMIGRAAQEVARREGASVLVETPAGLQVSHALKHALLCIVREATTNAVRHGDPSHVVGRLFEDDGIRLEVSDNGNGFDAERPGGFGLTTIRQRVSSWGGSANITSVPGEGTVVEVHVPSETVTGEGDSNVPTGHRLRRARARLQLVGTAG